MSLQRLARSQSLAIDPAEAWRFFSDPRNLARITPPWLDFRLVEEPPEEIYPGLIIHYRLRPLLGIPLRWVTEITQVLPQRFFIDEQRLGPYRFWHHQHRFCPVSGGTRVEDLVHYALPGGLLGDLLHPLLVRTRLEAIFAYRQRVLAELFGAAAG